MGDYSLQISHSLDGAGDVEPWHDERGLRRPVMTAQKAGVTRTTGQGWMGI